MISKLVNFLRGRYSFWHATDDLKQMQRWRDGRWEYRDPTPKEHAEAYEMWAIR